VNYNLPNNSILHSQLFEMKNSGVLYLPLLLRPIWRISSPLYFDEGRTNGRGIEISVECDAWQSIAAVAESLSSVASGDLLRPKG
jgi:hypothetical protein